MGKRKTISQLPRDITVNILSSLPVKSLLRFKCACKPWRSLVSSPQFAKLQLLQSQKHSNIINVNPSRALLSSNPPLSVDYEAYDGDDDDSKVITELEFPAAMKKGSEEYDDDVDLVGSSDGLVCLLLDDDEFILWNPTTRESRALPKPSSVPDGTFSYGLGNDFSTDDYRLLRVSSFADVSDGTKVEILSLRSNTWRKISDLQAGMEMKGNGIFLNRSLHWLAKSVSEDATKIMVIVSFCFAEEKFQEVGAAPDHLEENNVAVLGISGECLCICFECDESLYEGWVMKEYGVKSSWSRLFSNPVDSLPGYKYWQNALCYTKAGKVVMDHDGWELVMYDPKEQTTNNFIINDQGHYFVSPHFDDVNNRRNHVQG